METNFRPFIFVFILATFIFLTGCSTWQGIREDVSKPFVAVGELGKKIAPCKTETCKNPEWNLMFFEISHANKICFANDSNWSYIPIPKNGSHFANNFFPSNYGMTKEINWYKEKIKDLNYIVLIRNPIKRWLSGITEFVYHEMSRYERTFDLENIQVLDLLFNGVTFDAHTLPQSFYLEGLNLDNAYFFNLDNINFNKNLNYFLNRYLGFKQVPILKENTTNENIHKLEIYNKILNAYENSKRYQDNVGYRHIKDFSMLENLHKLKKIF